MRHGFLLIDKPTGMTSHDAVAIVRKRLSERSVGHLGTLDPAASGLLVLAVGKKALKVVEFFDSLHKEYIASITFGSVSSTYDRDGMIEEYDRKPGVNDPTIDDVKNTILERFIGNISQQPPAHSALKIGGERAYRKARRGEAVAMPERQVVVDECEILSYTYPHLELRIACGSGTYIRSIAHDLGQLLRCGAYLNGLRRTKVGKWSVDDAAAPDDATFSQIVPLKDVLSHFHKVDLTDEQYEDIKHGRSVALQVKKDTFAWHDGLPVAVLVPKADGSQSAKPRKVL